MRKLTKLLFFTSLLLLAVVGGAFYFIDKYTDDVEGYIFTGKNARGIYDSLFEWEFGGKYNLLYCAVPEKGSAFNSFRFHLQSKINKLNNIILLYYDDFSYYDPETISLKSNVLSDTFAEGKTYLKQRGYAVKYNFPSVALFNINKIPSGDFLGLYGVTTGKMKTVSCDSGLTIHTMISDIENLSVLVEPNEGFFKNVSKSIVMDKRKKGSINFVSNKSNKTIMMIHYNENIQSVEEYNKIYQPFLDDLCSLKIKD